MTNEELTHQVHGVLHPVLKKIGLPVLAGMIEILPPLRLESLRKYRKTLSQIESILEDYSARGRHHAKTLDLVRDCLTELHALG